MDLFEELRREYEFGLASISGVARKFGVHRRIVREALESSISIRFSAPFASRKKLPGGGTSGATEAIIPPFAYSPACRPASPSPDVAPSP